MAHYHIDARGLRWPEPLFHLEEQVRHLSARDTVELVATDPDAETELPEWCRAHGHYLIEVAHEGDDIQLVVEVGE